MRYLVLCGGGSRGAIEVGFAQALDALRRDRALHGVADILGLEALAGARSVPLWPQLEEILRAYFPVREHLGPGTLLFPSFRTGKEALLTDERKLIEAIAVPAIDGRVLG